ncbi:MAG: four-carbon acid sugar kinase family protein [Prolixibacteraceae bacterium]
MIAVIADDFTGAAEIGGIGLRHGLNVVIETNVDRAEKCDLLVIASDTRSMTAEMASAEIEAITFKLMTLKPRFIFKKLDSVLRGNIVAELSAQMQAMNKSKAIIVAGNPYYERFIKEGVYYVKGKPLAETFFANDPEFPIATSNVMEIIKSDHMAIVNLNAGDQLPDEGIVVGNVCCEAELFNWGSQIDNSIIAAGGSGFFSVLLKKYYTELANPVVPTFILGENSLFVFGSKFPKSKALASQMNGSSFVTKNMPKQIYQSTALMIDEIEVWANEITANLVEGQRVMVTIDHSNEMEMAQTASIKENIGLLISNVIKKVNINDLLIEGGATTSAILKQMNITKLYPFREFDHGVIQMKVDAYPELCITTKPGSYTWPGELWISKTNN